MEPVVVDLSQIARDETRDTLAGRSEGEASRNSLKLGAKGILMDLEIRIPRHVRVITPSFFIGLLGGSFRDRASAERVRLSGATATTIDMWERAKSAMFGSFSPFDNLR